MNQATRYWRVFATNDGSSTRFIEREDAFNHAKEMARQNPGRTIDVLELVGSMICEIPEAASLSVIDNPWLGCVGKHAIMPADSEDPFDDGRTEDSRPYPITEFDSVSNKCLLEGYGWHHTWGLKLVEDSEEQLTEATDLR